ncbi:hypothetical protein BB558_000836 [Smittium angustum]|uniref:Alcohol dehydrogenase-like C-terminal domain-containing protein n=1 Tax=Smittium angustum TaxID=133377 RepID=A0A2U1IVC0_SMIAN|nr:hypothetical protein BB558_007331 [Smittium angustum]PWA02998.1 hypothetical protein BB558_000836 [Smittium angustum]
MDHSNPKQSFDNPEDIDEISNFVLNYLIEGKVLVQASIFPKNCLDEPKILGTYKAYPQAHEIKNIEPCAPIEKVTRIIPGFEGAGRIIEIGPNAPPAMNGPIAIGDWVVPINPSSYSAWKDFCYADPSTLIVIKDKSGLTQENLFSLKNNASTAYRMIKDVVPLTLDPNEFHCDEVSSPDNYLIQLAHMWGYRTINVVRDSPNFNQLENELKSLGANIVIRDSDLDNKDLTNFLGDLDSTTEFDQDGLNIHFGTALSNYITQDKINQFGAGYQLDDLLTTYPYLIFKNIKFRGNWITKFYYSKTFIVWL